MRNDLRDQEMQEARNVVDVFVVWVAMLSAAPSVRRLAGGSLRRVRSAVSALWDTGFGCSGRWIVLGRGGDIDCDEYVTPPRRAAVCGGAMEDG